MEIFKKCNCLDIPDNTIHKIASVCVLNGQTLVVKKNGLEEYISLGGKHEGSETQEECLAREAEEELGVEVENPIFIGRYQDLVAIYNTPITIDAYIVSLTGNPTPNNEIDDYLWIGRDYRSKNIKIASILERYILPEIIRRGLI